MESFDEHIGRQVGRRKGMGDPVSDAAILLDTICRLRGPGLCPAGVYRFSTFAQADQWILQQSSHHPGRPS